MNNQNIVKYPNPILRKKAKKVEEVTEEIKNLGRRMLGTMIKERGIGLAAPQIGESKRIIIAGTEEKNFEVFVNPEIISRGRETEIMEEGCLSFPGLFLKIKRAEEVEVEALNLEGERVRIKARGLLARVFQHEIDHLDGILFIDRISLWQRIKLRISRY